jgi:hypothetical protein
MSNKPNIRKNGANRSARNLQVLLARGMAEVQAGGPGFYHVNVKHDDACPGLARQSMLWCECRPELDYWKEEA